MLIADADLYLDATECSCCAAELAKKDYFSRWQSSDDDIPSSLVASRFEELPTTNPPSIASSQYCMRVMSANLSCILAR